MSRPLKFRLRIEDKIVGYEWWSDSHWYYRQSGEEWSTDYIPHTDKDQFTDLHDKTGKEGYHKDIWVNGRGESRNIKCSIEWDRGRFFLQSIKTVQIKWSIGILPYGKIVGNPYENPELMEQK